MKVIPSRAIDTRPLGKTIWKDISKGPKVPTNTSILPLVQMLHCPYKFINVT